MRRTEDLLRFLGYNHMGDLGPWTFYTSKRKGIVWFAKAPPLEPPSILQTHQRNKFRLAGYAWRSLDEEFRQRWLLAARRANLAISGYNLFIYWLLTNDDAAVHTVERQSQLNLIPLQKIP